jgi:hypothetical protein
VPFKGENIHDAFPYFLALETLCDRDRLNQPSRAIVHALDGFSQLCGVHIHDHHTALGLMSFKSAIDPPKEREPAIDPSAIRTSIAWQRATMKILRAKHQDQYGENCARRKRITKGRERDVTA